MNVQHEIHYFAKLCYINIPLKTDVALLRPMTLQLVMR